MENIKNIQYIHTPFGGHRILSFVKKSQNEHGKGYYKMNTSILQDEMYKNIVKETIEEVQELQIQNEIEKWEIFLLTIKSKSITYSQTKNKTKRTLKNDIIKQIFEIEQNPFYKENLNILEQYHYLQEKLKDLEQKEIQGYGIRIKYLAPYDK